MSVKITDTCINCGACIDECPVEAIVDEDDNPTGEEIYYVFPDKCVECIGHHDTPACAEACPTEGCQGFVISGCLVILAASYFFGWLQRVLS